MSDLPEISNGHSKDEMAYGGEALTDFQRQVKLLNATSGHERRALLSCSGLILFLAYLFSIDFVTM